MTEHPTGVGEHRYGPHPAQVASLHRPAGAPRGVVVVIHGGFWRARYDASLGTPLAEDLAARGWAAWNLEYRRVGAGGGVPATLDDVAAGIDALRDVVPPLDLGGPIVALGHSAGGQLAAWAASRTRDARWAGGVEVTHVVCQAGVLDLAAAARDRLGDGAVEAFAGGGPGEVREAYALADPSARVPLAQPLWAVHARDDDTVPFTQSAEYVARATAAGADAALVEVTGGHFGVIDPGHPAWAAVLGVLDSIA